MLKRGSFIAAGAAFVAAPQIAFGEKLTPIRIATIPVEAYGLSYYAKDQGFFAANGLDAEIVPVPGAGPGITAALIGKAVEVGCVGIGPISNAYLHGIQLRIIGPGGVTVAATPTNELCVLKTSPIRTAADLNGKIVGTIGLRTMEHVAILKWIDDNGGNSHTVKIVEVPEPGAMPALIAGRIAAYPLDEPVLSAALAKDARSIGSVFAAIAPRVMLGVHAARLDWLEGNPTVAEKARLSLQQAATWVNHNPQAAGKILARFSKIPAVTIAEMKHGSFGESLDDSGLQPSIDALAKYGFLSRQYPVANIIWKAPPTVG